jgi:hypothetical protein
MNNTVQSMHRQDASGTVWEANDEGPNGRAINPFVPRIGGC